MSERWRVWLRGFTYFAEGKANLQNAARKRNELLYGAGAGSGVQDIFENLTIITAPEGQADDVYLQTVRTLNAYFRVQENAAYERYVLRQLRQEPGEDVDSFVLRLRKQARHCSYGPEELEFAVRDQLLEKTSSLDLRTKLFEEPNIQVAAAMGKARAWETARRQARNIAEGEGGQSKVNMVKNLDSKKPSNGFGTQKCYACGKVGHFARDKVCPARGKTSAKCGQKRHWAACCKSATESKTGGRVENGRKRGKKRSSDVKRDFKSRNKQVNQVEYDSGDEPYAFPINFNGERACEDNVIMVKIDNTTPSMLVDSGAQSTVLGERQLNNLVKSGLKAKLQLEERNLRVYGNGYLPVVGKFEASIECNGRKIMETILVTRGEGRCLLGSPSAKRLQVLKVGPELGDVANVYSVGSGIDGIVDRLPNVFSGVGKLAGYQLKLHIDPEVKPVAQKPRRISYPLKEKVTKKINELLDLDIIEKFSGPTTWVSPAVIAPKPNKDDVRICVDMRCANEAIRREKLPIPTVDEVLEEPNGSTVFSKLDMNMGFHEIELEEGSRDITTSLAGDSLSRYKRLSFGINSAPEQYQNIVRQTIAGCPGATNIADDIVVHGKTTEDHDRNLVTLLKRLQERNLTLNKDKCKIGMSQIVFMGLLLNKHGVGPKEEKVKAIREQRLPPMLPSCEAFWDLSVSAHGSCLILRQLRTHLGG